MNYEPLHQWIDAHKDELVAAIRELVAVKSVEGPSEPGAPFGPGPKAALDKFIEISDRMGFKTGVFEDQVGWADSGDPDADYVGVLAHVDVVPEGEGWSCDPYEGKIEDGYLYGRGVADDKGPAVIGLFAMKALQECGVKLKHRLRVMVGTNEETGSKAVEHYVKSGMPLPVAGFTPDAEWPLINGEKGLATIKLRAPFAPQGDCYVKSFKAGMAANAVPAKAEAQLVVPPRLHRKVERLMEHWVPGRDLTVDMNRQGDEVTFTVVGKSFHGMAPQRGASAAAELVAMLRLLDLGGSQGAFFNAIDDAVGHQGFGQSLGMACYDDISGFASLCMGLMNSDGDQIEFTWNYRYPVTCDPKERNDALVKAAQAQGFEVVSTSFTNPLYVPEDAPLVQKLMKAYTEETGRDEKPFAIGGGTYAKAMNNMVAFGICFPEEKHYIHEVDERWKIENILLTTKIIARALVELGEVAQ